MTASIGTHGRVLVAVDGSPSSLEALRQGRRQAALAGTTVVAITAWHQQNGLFPPMSYHPEQDSLEILQNSIREAFYPEIASDIEVLSVRGDPADVLIRLSQDAVVLVIGSRGHSGVFGTMLGSVSGRVAAHAHCPVLVVHDPAAVRPSDRPSAADTVSALSGGRAVATRLPAATVSQE